MLDKFEIEVVDIPTEENLVSEIFYEDYQWAQIYWKNGELLVQFFPHPNKEYWEFPINLTLQVLEKAKNRLLEIG